MRYLFTAVLLLLTSSVFAQVPPIKDAPAGGTGYVPLTPEKQQEFRAQSRKAHGGRISQLTKFTAVPPAFDCRDKEWCLPIGNQASCGSCYLYSTVYGTLTSAFIRAGYGKNDGSFVMSVQYGMDCHNFGGCNGGNGTEVIDWIVKNGWPAEKWVDIDGKAHVDYPPYAARSMACRKVNGAKYWKPSSWGFVNANGKPSVAEIKAAMYKFGPLNIALDAGGQFGNGTGTITSLGRNIDHEIECIGWDDNKDGGCFLLKNQWTTSWGNNGTRWITYKAAANILDWFFVRVDPLPPPPPDPEPPGPIPPGPGPSPGQILGTGKLINGQQFEMVPAGTLDRWNALATKVAEIQAMMDGLRGTTVPTTKEPPKDDSRIDRLEKNMLKIVEQMEKIEKLMMEQKQIRAINPFSFSQVMMYRPESEWTRLLDRHPMYYSKP